VARELCQVAVCAGPLVGLTWCDEVVLAVPGSKLLDVADGAVHGHKSILEATGLTAAAPHTHTHTTQQVPACQGHLVNTQTNSSYQAGCRTLASCLKGTNLRRHIYTVLCALAPV